MRLNKDPGYVGLPSNDSEFSVYEIQGDGSFGLVETITHAVGRVSFLSVQNQKPLQVLYSSTSQTLFRDIDANFTHVLDLGASSNVFIDGKNFILSNLTGFFHQYVVCEDD